MNLHDDIQPVSCLKSHKSCESMKNAFLMLKLMAQGEADIREGRHSDQVEVFGRIRSGIDQRRVQAA